MILPTTAKLRDGTDYRRSNLAVYSQDDGARVLRHHWTVSMACSGLASLSDLVKVTAYIA